MKKKLHCLLFAALLLVALFAFASCQDDGPIPTPDDECNHSWHEEVLEEPWCTHGGHGVRYCELCGYTEHYDIPELGHDEVHIEYLAPTCTACGHTEGSYCARCEATISEPHDIEPNGHTPVTDEGYDATCTEDGLTDGSHCSVCEAVLEEQTVIEAYGHDWSYSSLVEATCTEDGHTAGQKCSRCQHVEVEETVIPKKGHTEVIDAGYAATCTEEGLTDGKHCSVCEEIIVEQTVIPSKGHTIAYNDEEATCQHGGKSGGVYCSVCEAVFSEATVSDRVGHVFVNGTCKWCHLTVSTGLEFTLNAAGDGYLVGIGTCTGTDVVIPDTYNGKPVVAIAFEGFKGCTTIKSVTVTGTATTVSGYAFSGCTSLETVTLPKSVLTVGDGAFSGCTSLKTVTCADFTQTTGWSKSLFDEGSTARLCAEANNGKTPYEVYLDALKQLSVNANSYVLDDVRNIVLKMYSYLMDGEGNPIDEEGNPIDVKNGDQPIPAWIDFMSMTMRSHTEYAGTEYYVGTTSVYTVLGSQAQSEFTEAAYYNGYLYGTNASGQNVKLKCGTEYLRSQAQAVVAGAPTFSEDDFKNVAFCKNADGTYSLVIVLSGEAATEYGKYMVSATGGLKETFEILAYKDITYTYLFDKNGVLSSIDCECNVEGAKDSEYEGLLAGTITCDMDYSNVGTLTKLGRTPTQTYTDYSYTGTCTHGSTTTVKGYDATCTETGLTDGSYCSRCYANVTVATVIPAKGHTVVDGVCTVCNNPAGYSTGLKYVYNADGKTATLVGLGSCTDKNVVIPTNIYGITITKIGKDAFKGATGVTSLTIPATVTTIEAGALTPLTALEKISLGTTHIAAIPKTVRSVVLTSGETIASGSFVDFKSLSEITLPETLTTIEDGAFSGCTKLVLVRNNSELYIWAGSTDCGGVAEYAEEVVTKGGSSSLIVQGDFVFKKESSRYYLVKYIGSSTKVTLPATCNGETYLVAEGAFSDCAIKELTAPANIVPDGSASSLLGFDDVQKVVGDLSLIAVLPKEHLTHVEIISNKNGRSSSNSLFDSAPELVWVKLDVDVDYGICYKCDKLETVIIGDGVTKLTQHVFKECPAVNLTVGAGVQEICSSAFGTVNKLYIENVAKWCAIEFNYNSYWYSDTFNPIANAKEVWIGNGPLGGTGYSEFISLELWAYKQHEIDVSAIAPYAFYNYKGLTELNLDNSTAKIGDNAFAGCTALQAVIFGNPSAMTVGDNAFAGCTALQEVTLTSCAAKLGSSAFAGCTSLKTVTLTFASGSGSSAFSACTALTTVTLGKGTSTVPSGAFKGCTSLKTVTLPDDTGLTSIGDNAFSDCTALAAVTLPEGLTTIGASAFKGAAFYTITLPKSLTSIGNSAFYECYHLFEVVNRSSLTVTANNTGNGYVGKYATIVVSGETATSTLETRTDGFVFARVTSGDTTTLYLVTYLGTEKRITLPDIGGNNYEIAPYAFAGSRVVTLVIPDKVTNIGKYAFKDSALRSLTVGSGITSKVSSNAFYDLELAELVNNSQLSDSDLIGEFRYNSDVEYCHAGSSELTEDANGFLFLKHDGEWHLVSYVGADVETLYLPDNIGGKNYHVGEYAFLYAEISAIEVPNGVLSFASSALPTDFAGYTVDEGDPEQANYVGNATNPHLVLVKGGRTDWSSDAKTESVTVNGNLQSNYAVKVNINENTKIISDNAFSSYNDAMVVSIPNSVTYIGDKAFYYRSVYSLTLGEKVAYIGDEAFYNTRMEEISIPKSVSHVGTNAFADCDNLKTIYWNAECVDSVDMPFGYSYVSSFNNGITKELKIGKDVKTVPDNLLYHTRGSSYAIVSSVTVEAGAKLEKIGAYAFYQATGLSSIDLSSATEIGNGAFLGSDLASVTLGSSLTTIGDNAFTRCQNLTELTIPESVTSIGEDVLQDCANIKKLTLPGGIISIEDLFGYSTYPYEHDIPENIEYTISGSKLAAGMFRYVASGSISFTGTVTEVGSYAFSGCTWLTDEIFASAFGNLKTIGDNAFKGCTGLTAIDLSRVETIGEYAFSGCTALTGKDGKLELSSVKSIGEYAFKGCTSLTEVIVNGNAAKVEASAFNGCTGITKLTVPVFITVDSVKELTINGSATEVPEQFYRHPFSSGYSKLKKLTLPSSIETIGDQAFESCPNLATVNFGDLTSLKTIGDSAFRFCNSLEADFQEGLTSIGEWAFQSTKFTKLIVPSTLETLGSNSLFGSTSEWWVNCEGVTEYEGCYYVGNSTNPYLVLVRGVDKTASTPLTVHKDTKFIAESAFSAFNYMTELTIGASVTYIGDSAFNACRALTKINIASLEQWNNITFGESYSSGEQYQPFASGQAENAGLYVNGTLVNEITYTGGGYNSFSGYKRAATITVASGVTSIPDNAFKDMGTLKNVHLPEGLVSIGDYAFSGCIWLETINIPSTVTSIGKYAFEMTRITSVTLPDGLTTLQEGVFKKCLKLGHFDLNNVITIEANALYQCTNVRWLYIPSTVTTIKSGAFTESSVYICTQAYSEPSGWEYGWDKNATARSGATIYTDDDGIVYAIINGVSAYLLDYVGTSTELTIPETANGKKVGLIVAKAFKDNAFLEKVTMLCSSDGGTVIGDYAFAGCPRLTTVEIGGNCSKIGYNAFQGCTALTTVTIDANCSMICRLAFDGCTSLASLTFNTDSSKSWYYYDAVIDLSDPATNAKYFNGTENVLCTLTDAYTGEPYTREVNGTLYEWEAK